MKIKVICKNPKCQKVNCIDTENVTGTNICEGNNCGWHLMYPDIAKMIDEGDFKDNVKELLVKSQYDKSIDVEKVLHDEQRRKRKSTKPMEYKHRKDGLCALYPKCNNPVTGRSVFCDKHKAERKSYQTKDARKIRILDKKEDKSAHICAETMAYDELLQGINNTSECEGLISVKKQQIKSLVIEKEKLKKSDNVDWDKIAIINEQIRLKRTEIAMTTRRRADIRDKNWGMFDPRTDEDLKESHEVVESSTDDS